MLLNLARAKLAQFVAGLPFLTAALIAAGIIHIITTLVLAEISVQRPYARLKRALPANTVHVISEVTAERQLLPFMMPHMAYAFCRFDVSTGPVFVKATLEMEGWSLSLHGPDGENFHLVPGVAQRLTPVELIIVPPGGRFYAHTPELLFANEQVPEVKPFTAKGLVVLRAPLRSAAHRGEIQQRLRSMICRPLGAGTGAPMANVRENARQR